MSSQLKQQQLELENSKQIVQEQEQLMQSYSKSVADLQAIKDELEKKLLESRQQLQEEVHGHELQMNELTKSYQAEITELRKDLESQQQTWSNEVHTLEQENTALRDRVRGLQPHGSSGPAVPNVMAEVKKVMNLVYHTLQPQFVPEASYDGLKIRQTLMATLRDVTLKYIEIKSSTSEHPTDTAHGRHAPAVTPQVVDARVEPAAVTVASETGNGVSTVESSSADRLSAREESNSVSKPIQNPELGIAASCLAETISDGQEKKGNDTEELKRGSLVEKQADSDAQKQDCAGEATTPAEAAAAAAMIGGGDITGPAEDGKEKDRHSQESSLESSWRPQPPPPPLFDDDDDDDDWLS
ncbi:hypothetical protein L798_11867 [Zootermopsis nevadensis]|uniref:FK506-binding protein 15 n=2 Tax=Zootermopsis nevadensis TaxID=136037 RepID=A0A067QRM3_ZOONE|nr:hypothetical protein L798_11867 [Zootermopsis nevadensis]